MLTSEQLYTQLLRDGVRHVRPGRRGDAKWTVGTSVLWVAFELRANAVWKFGRVFLRCPTCCRLVTRIYVPTTAAPAQCRLCWGLTYESRQRNYKDSGLFAIAGLTLRWFAQSETLREREGRAEAARERYAERRAILTSTAAT